MGCLVAKAVIQQMRAEDLVCRSRIMGHLFLKRLKALVQRQPLLREARGPEDAA